MGEKVQRGMRNIIYALIGFIIIGGIIINLISMYWPYITLILAVVALVYIMKKKKKHSEENWVENNLPKLENAMIKQLQETADYQNMLMESNHFTNNYPTFENTKVYHTLDQRNEYLETVESKLINTYNKIVPKHYPYLPQATNRHGVEDGIRHITWSLMNNYWNGYDQVPNDDAGKQSENELFFKNNVDISYISELRQYYSSEFNNFMYELYPSVVDNSKSVIEIEQAIINAGLTGERRLQEELDMYSDVLKVLYNVRLDVDGNSVESDAIIVSTKGVFTIEAKNFSATGSYSIRITKDGQWRKVFPNGNEEPMKNVVSQANRHVAYKQRFINNLLKEKGYETDYLPVQSIIVIANDTIRIENESDFPIIRISQVYNYIQKLPDSMSKELIDVITNLFEEHKLESLAFPHRCYEKELEFWLNFMIPLSELSVRAGVAHKIFIDLIAKNAPGNQSLVFLYGGYLDLDFPVYIELETIKKVASKIEKNAILT